MRKEGKVWKYGDNVNTDLLFPGRYTYIIMTEEEMAKHALEDLDTEFVKSDIDGDILVAGENWGCGSSREQAVKALKARKVGAVICKSVARIYFRNALNEGFPVIVCASAVDAIEKGDLVAFDLDNHYVEVNKNRYEFAPYPKYIQNLVDAGGLLPLMQKIIKEKKEERK